MKKILLLAVVFLLHLNVYASHIFGGELLYTYISGNTYQVTLTLYGNCAGAAFPSLDTTEPYIHLYNHGTLISSVFLPLSGPGVEVSPVCPSQINNTTCHNPSNTLPGVTRYIYSNTITVSGVSNDWEFVFDGNMYGENTLTSPPSVSAGRSNNITNIIFDEITVPGGGTQPQSVMYLVATLNNTQGNNSSPKYTTIPTPYYCINLQEEYNQGAADPDNDSLAFALVAGLDGDYNGAPVSYNAPYSATYPLSTSTGGFNFNPQTGQMTFTPNIVQDALVVNQVSEYRNGVVVGTSMREMTFIIQDDCNDTPPYSAIEANTVSGGGYAGANVINVCQGTPNIAFSVNVGDSDGSNVKVNINNIPTGSNITVNNDSTTDPTVNFSWNTSSVPAGVYYFYLNLKNDHCPTSSSQTIAYTINIVGTPSLTDSIIRGTACSHQAYIAYNAIGGAAPWSITIEQGGDTIKTVIDSTGIVTDSLPKGNYTAIINSNAINCPGTFNFTIPDSGTISLPQYPIFSYCIGDTASQIIVVPVADSAIITWYDMNGNVLPNGPTPGTTSVDTAKWYVTEQYHNCFSNNDTITAIVHPLPKVTILNQAEPVCYGDIIYLYATGGTNYVWSPQENIKTDQTGLLYSIILTPITYTVRVTDQYNCSNSDSVTYSQIEQCCKVSYPNAFTPNNDGVNDYFKIVTYGNIQAFYLRIYDRWGECVFSTNNPDYPWDGTFNGKPCQPGTYFYYSKVQCLTGHTEAHKGTITLLE